MNLSRNSWALCALALTLVLGACGTPDNLTAPTLEPQFGSSGDDVGFHISVAPNGGAYAVVKEDVRDSDGSTYTQIALKRFDSAGKLLWSNNIVDYRFTGCGEEREMTGLHTDAQGNANISFIFFDCEDEYHSFSKYNSLGRYLSGTKNYVPGYGGDVAYDSKGNIFYTSASSDSVSKVSMDGSQSWGYYIGDVMGAVTGVAVSGNGNVYVSGSNGVARYSNAGTLVWKIAGAATDIAAVGTNTVYARNLTTVRKLDASGKQLWSRAQSGLSGMVVGDMTTDSKANVYLTGKYGPSSNRDVFTRKLSASSGSTLFTKTFGTSVYDDARSVATVDGSVIYITGATKGALAQPFRGGDTDGYVRKLSSSGSPVWTR